MGNYDHSTHKQIIIRASTKGFLDGMRGMGESYNDVISRILLSASGSVLCIQQISGMGYSSNDINNTEKRSGITEL